MKLVIFIPPNGNMVGHDFSIHRLGTYFKNIKNVKTVIVKIDNKKRDTEFDNGNYIDEVINVSSQEELFKTVKKLNANLIFHRSWMLTYSFASKLVEKFDNVIVNIKDWNFAPKEEYEFIFENHNDDFEGVEYIFKNAKFILSHFTKQQVKRWAKKYNVNKNKFIFFPEYCNEENFIYKNMDYDYKNIKLVFAGMISRTSYPEQLFPWKSHIRSILKLTKQKINVDFVLPNTVYDTIFGNKNLYFDWLYENKFNKRMNLVKGKTLFFNKNNNYNFGFFELETSGKYKELYEYAIISKFAFYLESALPILVNKDFKAISHIVKKHNIGIVFSNNDLNNLTNILKITQKEYNQMIENLYVFRKTYTFENNYKKLNKILKD